MTHLVLLTHTTQCSAIVWSPSNNMPGRRSATN